MGGMIREQEEFNIVRTWNFQAAKAIFVMRNLQQEQIDTQRTQEEDVFLQIQA